MTGDVTDMSVSSIYELGEMPVFGDNAGSLSD
jgi:hypothetical protein